MVKNDQPHDLREGEGRRRDGKQKQNIEKMKIFLGKEKIHKQILAGDKWREQNEKTTKLRTKRWRKKERVSDKHK